MSRLSNQSYLLKRSQLRNHWLDEPYRAFFLLTPSEQWVLHLYYLLSEQLSDEALIEHREDISVYDPSLPQRAGRALARLNLLTKRLETYRATPKPERKKKNAPYELLVLSEVHPVINVDQVAKILLNYKWRDEDKDSESDAA